MDKDFLDNCVDSILSLCSLVAFKIWASVLSVREVTLSIFVL